MDRIKQAYKKIVHLRPNGFWPGFIVGLFYFGFIFWWFWSVHSLLSLGIENKILSFLIILLPYLITVIGMSLFWGIFSYVIYLSKNIKFILLPFLYASIFVLAEYLRSWFFGILWAGRNSLIASHWTIGNPAYLFANFDFIRQSSHYWGIYGIDFLIIFFGAAVLLLIKLWRKELRIVLLLEASSVVIILALINFALSINKFETKDSNNLTVSVIQTKNPIKTLYEPEELLTDFSEKNRLLKEASKKSSLVVFPETTNFSKTLSGFLDSASAQKYFNNLSQKSILIIDNNRISEQDGLKSKVILIDSKKGISGFYDKKLLTPGGESIPYIASLPFWVFERIFKNDFISSRAIYAKGEKNNIQNYRDDKIKIIVCSDIISPNISREGNNFDFIVNLNNLAVFNGNSLIESQLLSMARFRAAENGKYLIISSNFGHSYIINPLGNIMDSTKSTGYQMLTRDIVSNQVRTWYNRFGDKPVLIFSFLIILAYLKPVIIKKF